MEHTVKRVWPQVGTADTADYDVTVEQINEKNEQLTELQEKMLGSPRSIKKVCIHQMSHQLALCY